MKNSKYINTQRLKGLLAGWKNISTSFKKKEDHKSAGIIDYCIIDLTSVLATSNTGQEDLDSRKGD